MGCQDPANDSLDMEPPTATTGSQKFVIFQAAQNPSCVVETCDDSPPRDKGVVCAQPHDDRRKTATVLELLKAPCGLNDAPRRQKARLRRALLKF
eukprot:14578846-Heterocapsa_arctica.AAC.1